MPDLDDAGHGQREQDEREQHRRRSGSRSGSAASGSWSAITPAEQPEDDHRPELGDRHEARARAGRGSAGGRASAWATCCIHVPIERDQLAAEEQPVVAVAEGAERRGSRSVDRHRTPLARRPARGVCGRGLADRLELVEVARGGARGGPRPRSIIASRRSDFAAERSRSGDRPGRARRRRSRVRSAGSLVERKRSRLRARAASSSSSWPISARLNPASSRRSLMNCRRSTSSSS